MMNTGNLFPILNPNRSTRTLFDSLNREMAKVLSDFDTGSLPIHNLLEDQKDFLTANLDYSETEDAVEITVDVPGFKESEINIEVSGSTLVIGGKRETREEDKKKNYLVIERQSGSFQRRINLDFIADPEKISAQVDAGILTITVEKPEEKKVKTQKIDVKSKQADKT